jgi:hypothetical protein
MEKCCRNGHENSRGDGKESKEVKKRVQRPLATIEVEIGNVLMGIDGLSIASSS